MVWPVAANFVSMIDKADHDSTRNEIGVRENKTFNNFSSLEFLTFFEEIEKKSEVLLISSSSILIKFF